MLLHHERPNGIRFKMVPERCDNGILEEGMITSDEPGLYIEEEGIGVRIEDDIIITEEKAINLSSNILKTVEDIEALMKK